MNLLNMGRVPFRPLVSAALAVSFLIAVEPGARGQGQADADGAGATIRSPRCCWGRRPSGSGWPRTRPRRRRSRPVRSDCSSRGTTSRSPTPRSRCRAASRSRSAGRELPEGMTWERLAAMSPRRSARRACSRRGSSRCRTRTRGRRHGLPADGDQAVPRLERFDLDFDLPEHFLPEFPPAIFLTTRPDLGDVSQGKVVTIENFQEIFAGHPQRQGPGGPAAAGHAVPAAAVQRHGRPQDREPRRHAGRGLLRLPRQRPHLRGDPPGRATSGRSRTAAASTRRACAA